MNLSRFPLVALNFDISISELRAGHVILLFVLAIFFQKETHTAVKKVL